MSKMFSLRLTILRFVTVVAASTICANAVNSQARPAAGQNAAEVHKHFQASIDALAAKWQIAIVAESSPIIEKAGADLTEAQPNETVDQAVGRIAAAFDYSVKQRGTVFILNKQFTDPNDLPDVTMEEASAVLDDMLQILPSINARYMPRSTLGGPTGVMRTVLTHEELAALDHGGVPISSLTADQRIETWNVTEAIQYAKVIDDAKESAYFIQGALAHDPEFHWSYAQPEYREFGYDVSIVSGAVVGRLYPTTVLKPLSHPNMTKVTSDGLGLQGRGVMENGEPVPDPSEPQVQSAEQVCKLAAMDRVVTLSEAVSRINARAGQNGNCIVDKELAGKAVTVAGDENARAVDIATACADIYGLQARHRTGGGITIARRIAPRVSGPAEVNSALLIVIPDSVLRCVIARTAPLRVGVDADRIKSHPWTYGKFNAGQIIMNAACRQVRSVAQPLALASPTNRIALSLLPSGSRTAFAVSQSVEAFVSALVMRDNGPPTVLLDFDHAVLTGSFAVTPSQTSFTLQVCAPDPKTGQLIGPPGSTVVEIPSNSPLISRPVSGQ